MATVKVLLNKRYKSKDNTYPIIVRVIDGIRQRVLPVGFKVQEIELVEGMVTRKHPDHAVINSKIAEVEGMARKYVADCELHGKPIHLDLIDKKIKSYSFIDYLKHRKNQHEQAKQEEMKLKVGRYIKEFDLCFGRDLYFEEIDQDLLRVFDTWLIKQGNINNTRAKKFEFLGKYYTNAINEGKATPPNPFKEYKIKTTPVKKEKLSLEHIKAIEDLPLKGGLVSLARDLFLFSYYCKGIRFETVITMPKKALKSGRLEFQINKGKRFMSTAIHPKLQAIIDKYIDNKTDTIFGRLHTKDLEQKKRSIVGSENTLANRGLKEVAALANIPVKLTMHISRHSLAFHLKKVSSVAAIQDILGHSRSQITEVYLKELDDEYLDGELSKIYG